MNKVIIAFSLLMFVIISGAEATAGSKPAAKNQLVEIQLKREILGRTPTVDVVVNGKTRTFYLDTGGGISGISPALAKEIGCTPLGEMRGFDAGGRVFKVKRCEDVEMNLNGFAVKHDVAVFDPMQFFPNAAAPIEGSIALDAFENQVVTLDLKGNHLWIENEKSFKQRISGMKPLRSRLSREIGGATLDVFVAANSPKGKVWMLLDTGNTNKMLFAPSAQEQLGLDFNGPDNKKIIKPVKLDIIGLGEVEAEGRERDMIYDGMLNYDTIAKMLFTINLRTGEMWAKLNQ
jgi:hypothetical protein